MNLPQRILISNFPLVSSMLLHILASGYGLSSVPCCIGERGPASRFRSRESTYPVSQQPYPCLRRLPIELRFAEY